MKDTTTRPAPEDFRALGVPPGAPAQEVKRAFRALARRFHPDLQTGRTPDERRMAERRFREVAAAYGRIVARAGGRERRGFKAATERPPPPRAATPGPRWPPPAPPKTRRHRVRALPYALGAALITLMAAGLPPAEGPAPPPVSQVERKAAVTWPPRPPAGARPETPPDLPPVHPVRPPAAAGLPFMTLGSSPEDVLRVQGPPTAVRGSTWAYGLSEVRFREGRVISYDNFDGALKVRLLPVRPFPPGEAPARFDLGATEDDVLSAQGTPTRVEGRRWLYGMAEVRFREGRVVGFENRGGRLRIGMRRPGPGVAGARSFAVGDPVEALLALHGPPEAVRGNLWSYGVSDVLVREGVVRWVNNAGGNLRFAER